MVTSPSVNAGLARLYDWLHATPNTPAARRIQGSIQFLILLNIITLVAETVHPWSDAYASVFHAIETVSIALFSLEYLARLASCTVDPRFGRAWRGRLRYALTPMALVDLLAIAPAFLPWLGLDLRVARALRLMRVFRILKLGRYSKALQTLARALTARKEELATTLFVLLILLMLASSLVYYAEREAQPEVFRSIPAAAWWAIATLTTVGYGDVTPITLPGRLAASVIAVLGIGLFALPAGILGSAFIEQAASGTSQPTAPEPCPHCGQPLAAGPPAADPQRSATGS